MVNAKFENGKNSESYGPSQLYDSHKKGKGSRKVDICGKRKNHLDLLEKLQKCRFFICLMSKRDHMTFS